MNLRLGIFGKIALLFLAAGLVVSPLDNCIQKDRHALKYGGKPISLKLRQQMGQGMAIAFLGGFRGIVADFLWIKLHAEFEQNNMERIPPLLEAVTSMQPQCALYWDIGSWHLAYNIYHYWMYKADEPNPEIRRRKAMEFLKLGEQILLEAIENLPNDATPCAALARLYDDRGKFNDPDKAARYWKLCLGKENCQAYAQRAVGHSLHRSAEIHGNSKRYRTTFDWWRDIWLKGRDNPIENWPAVRREMILLRELNLHFGQLTPEDDAALGRQEAELGIAAAERVFARDETSMNQQQLRERLNLWVWEWLRPHDKFTALWDFNRARVIELKARVPMDPEEEEAIAAREEHLKIPLEQRIFKYTPLPPKTS